ncbi:3-oxoacyl-[acyl-carrier-protein] synthase III C-terminal domain-containing protein [Advenella mimigardefordensis]|uniref:Putative 3-oxoacyl-[acyl-carrier-protein] synthase 3 n=1 Tax=Advenella mimigardefordensis (strain DSM 17166 / LMG 22922 / DPN7) TaxID=1247726 RepID=W0PKA8_ADVMD|nr:3-oxoacyl-[acyl-carrier-protein] synthase III C-terminal domain-containing protein [Advenella mimigardefordensis]AHG65428.1 putative 3-oxoacyl-[acyl-carrier-protein] synthase 3 [Advenella mimigardefordensis DPN7]
MGMMPFWISEIASVIPDARIAPPTGSDDQNRSGYISVAVEKQRVGGELAHDAVINLVATVGSKSVSRVEAIFHASVIDQGMGVFWNPGYALQNHAGAEKANALSLRQGCNGLMLALIQAGRLSQHGKQSLIAGSDCFEIPGFNRFVSDYGIMYGDGATACIVGSTTGRFKVIDIVEISSPKLAPLHDGRGFPTGDVRSAKRRYLERNGKDCLTRFTRKAMDQLSSKAKEYKVERILFPNLGKELLETNYYPAFDCAEERSAGELGKRIGHLGTADQLVALDSLHRSGEICAGKRLLLVGAGSGFSWSGIVVEVA